MIQNIQIYGERCSGTNYLENLLTINFEVSIKWNYGHKHFFGFTDLKNSDDTLFVCIIRNPFTWINSLFQKPWHLQNELLKKNNFLNKSFWSYTNNLKTSNQEEILTDRNIYTNEKYKNIFEARKIKTKFLLNDLPTKVKNYIFIKYEDLLNNFEETMNKLKDKELKIKSNKFPENTDQYKKENKKYVENKTIIFTEKEILNNIDFDIELEKSLGYIN